MSDDVYRDIADRTRDIATAVQVELRSLHGMLEPRRIDDWLEKAKALTNVALEHAEQIEEGLWQITETQLERSRERAQKAKT